MKKILPLLLSLLSWHVAEATTYTYVGSNGEVSTYTAPAATGNAPADGTVLVGQLAGNVAAAGAARAANNPAAVMGTQSALINTGASAISSSIISVFHSQ